MLGLMKTIPAIGVGALLACMCVAAMAAPAAWFKWRSKADGKLVCHQTPLGPGWEKASGPFRDSHCTKEIPPHK
ncbi:hypothetical protein KY495_23045 [Massilia sp. PAMC28688]|nr:hypothetical protein KY495_23045 [Massilia sp. PAMC28688]